MFEKLKKRWQVKSNLQLVIILVVFAITGSSTVFIRKPIFTWLGITSETPLWITIPLYLIIIIPSYQILLLVYGTLFGQFRFFWEFEKKMLRRMRILK